MSTLLVGTRKGLFVLDTDGADRAATALAGPHFPAVPVSAVLADPRDGAWYVALDHGHFGTKLHRSDDRGATWTELPAPEYPADAGPVPNSRVDPTAPASLKMVWCLEAAHAAQPGTIFAGTVPGGLFRSDDHGATWALVRSMWDHPDRPKGNGGGYDEPGIHSISVDPRGPGRYAVGSSCNGVWVTDDDGATWTLGTGMWFGFMPENLDDDPAGQDPHRVVRCQAAPDVMWTQHHCGIWRSDDTGLTWRNIADVAPSSFGFALAVHPTDPATAWFAPAHSDLQRIPVDGKVVVTRTTDGGATFAQLTDGLPQEHAYHLIYRHGLDVDATGTTLAMASTTGSLWLGHDGGERWERVSAELPPVLCVRWT